MSHPLASIVLRSYNEAWALKETLERIARQAYPSWELIVFDSGSTDGSVELIRQAQPAHFVQLQPREYIPGRVMNQAMQLARSNQVIFLNADATPVDRHWLEPLAQTLLDPQVAAVFGKQIPRPNCRAVYACDYERCFGQGRESAQWEHFFSMVSSGLQKEVWAKRGFLESLQYAEDDEYTRWCRTHGHKVVYCPESVVVHSHNYTPEEAYKRSYGDARALAASYPGRPSSFNYQRTVLLGWLSDFRHDLKYCARKGCWNELWFAARVRWSQRRGKLDGFRDGWHVYRDPNRAAIIGHRNDNEKHGVHPNLK
jgi:rhamnosyltransferase